ncbi:MAG: amidohydrolase family protein [Acetobacteraceae bacterium]|nr:amidohydrolase family protein [Acetobacteraceae bacterium]
MTAIIDTHCHVFDLTRFPLPEGPGYKPGPNEVGTSDEFCAVLDAHGVAHAVLVQPSGYGTDNRAILDAMQRHPGRFRAIAVIDPAMSDREMGVMSDAGVRGVRFNLQSYRSDALDRGAERFLDRLAEIGWFAQVFADDAQWAHIGPALRRSGVTVLVDHFGVLDPAPGLQQSGFQAVLALGREGRAFAKLSAPFRISRAPAFADLGPFADALLAGFGIERCLWGSDWPFINFPAGFSYANAVRAASAWVPDPQDRVRLLWTNPARVFGFPEGSRNSAGPG